ncbi:hypothetical protein TRIP_C21436 [Candidatus Zixiibacteriota bacterium]|nr:hypothetical protein TRIP_C21436 [candidate division Zixibacteria bacterium]
MKFELKAIGYWSLIKTSFVINLIVGFIMGIFFALFIGAIFSFAANMGGLGGSPLFQEGMPPIGLLLILYPFLFGFGGAIFYTILFVIIAFVYNMTAKLLGGLEFDLQQVAVMQPVQPPPSYYQAPPAYPTPPSPPPPPPVQPLPPDMTPPPDNQPPAGPTI